MGGEVTGSKFICISSCEGKYPGRDNGKLFFFKSQKGRL